MATFLIGMGMLGAYLAGVGTFALGDCLARLWGSRSPGPLCVCRRVGAPVARQDGVPVGGHAGRTIGFTNEGRG
jgi:hypothetical protein